MNIKKSIPKKCSIKICTRPITSFKHQLCRAHALRYYQGKKVEGPIKKARIHMPYKAAN